MTEEVSTVETPTQEDSKGEPTFNPGLTSPLTGKQLAALMSDLSASRISTRKQGGANLSYLEGWDVKASLTRVFGFANWSSEALMAEILRVDDIEIGGGNRPGFKVSAMAKVRLFIHQTGALYTEYAVGGATLPDVTEAFDMAVKTAETDALKRCAINLGTQFGLSLYNSGSREDVIKILLDPAQSQALLDYRREQEAQAREGGDRT